MARMQKMPMPKVPARGSITDKKKLPMPVNGIRGGNRKQPMPKTPMPYKGGGVLDQLKKLAPGGAKKSLENFKQAGPRNKKAVPGYAVGKAVGNSLNKQKMQKAVPSQMNKLQGMVQAGPGRGRPGTNKGGGKFPVNFKRPPTKGKLGKPRVTRPVQPPRRGSR